MQPQALTDMLAMTTILKLLVEKLFQQIFFFVISDRLLYAISHVWKHYPDEVSIFFEVVFCIDIKFHILWIERPKGEEFKTSSVGCLESCMSHNASCHEVLNTIIFKGSFYIMFLFIQEYVMVFEEDVLATKHYLDLMAQCLPALGSDESLVGISAWNENGKSLKNETVSSNGCKLVFALKHGLEQ